MSKSREGDGERLAHLPKLYVTSDGRESVAPTGTLSERSLMAEPPPSVPSRRYSGTAILGSGGMGRIDVTTDRVIGRDIAMKSLTSRAVWARERFLREARVQGQLEHPVVVPVYDMGVSEAGEVFFTMKRIVGKTLDDVLGDIRRGDAATTARFTTRRLVAALSQVALALAFAHSRGVVHRDVKPANVMFGDYGEVYLLDWGIAKVSTRVSTTDPPASADLPPTSIRDVDEPEPTMEGAVLGSAGYMAPEQAHGRADLCDARTDVYSIGVLLYEVLTLEHLHRGDTRAELVASTLALDGAEPSAARIDVPTDLDLICYRATRLDPQNRYQDIRELHEDLEAHLDGARDIERRNTLADEHSDRAAMLRDEIHELGNRDPRVEGLRAQAMRELASALVLSPTHRAQSELFELMMESPDSLSKNAERELETKRDEGARRVLVKMAWSYALWFLLVPLALWMGVRSFVVLGAFAVFGIALVGALAHVARRPERPSARVLGALFAANFVGVACLSMFFGPAIAVPQAALAVGTNAMFVLRPGPRGRALLAIVACIAVAIPFVLSGVGVLPPQYTFEHGTLVVHPLVADLSPTASAVLLVLATLAPLFTPTRILGTSLDELTRSERRSIGQAHRLRGFLPLLDEARTSRYTRPSS